MHEMTLCKVMTLTFELVTFKTNHFVASQKEIFVLVLVQIPSLSHELTCSSDFFLSSLDDLDL